MTEVERIQKVAKLQDNFDVSYRDFSKSSTLLKDLWKEVCEKFIDEDVKKFEENYNEFKGTYRRTIEDGEYLLRHEDKDLTRSLGEIFRKCEDKLDDVENVIRLIYETLLKIKDGETFSYFE